MAAATAAGALTQTSLLPSTLPSPNAEQPPAPIMDPKSFTEKVTSLLNAAHQLASEHSHQQLTPIHVAIVLFEDPEGVALAALRKAAPGPDALQSVLRMLRKALVRLPAVTTGGGDEDLFISADLKRALQAAQKLQRKKGDSFLGE